MDLISIDLGSVLKTIIVIALTAIIGIETALALFQAAATQQTEATENGDYKAANKNYDKIIDIMDYLKRENSTDRLHDFLSAPSVGVRLWAAQWRIGNLKFK